MTPNQRIAAVALEYWRASGARTTARLDALVTSTIEAYHGPSARWTEVVKQTAEDVRFLARGQTRAYEITD